MDSDSTPHDPDSSSTDPEPIGEAPPARPVPPPPPAPAPRATPVPAPPPAPRPAPSPDPWASHAPPTSGVPTVPQPAIPPASAGRPPTAPWMRPPTSDAPPRPGVNPIGPGATFGVPPSGPPSAYPVAGGEEPPRRRWPWVIAGVIAAALLLVAGFAAGSLLDDDDEPTASPPSAGDIRPAVESAGTPIEEADLEDVPGPIDITDDEAFVEPVAAVARAVSPSVVRIDTNGGQGSGIVWDAERGLIVTNDHVIGDASEVRVTFADGLVLEGSVVGGDEFRDVAVVEVDPTDVQLTAAIFAPAETVEVGQLAVAIGAPFNLDQTVTSGIVSAANRVNPQGGSDPTTGTPVTVIQTDAPINPGNSGGALADREGRVVGMNTSIRTDGLSQGNVGVGFAVPSDTVVLIARRIVNGEPLEPAFLGVQGEVITDGSAGSVIREVTPGSAADGAGLKVGDRIIALDGSPVASINTLSADIKLYRPGDTVIISFERAGQELEVDVVLGSREPS